MGRKAVAVFAALLVLSAGWAVFFRSTKPAPEPVRLQVLSRDEIIDVGGVRRPITDVKTPPAPQDSGAPFSDYGTFPAVPIDANEQVASVVEAITTETHPERLSILVPPAAFDKEAYEKSPDEYLRAVEPGRVWQTAKPGVGVPRLRSLTPRAARIEQGEPLSLRVQAVPRAPVTFVALDGGEFQNRLRTITVQADKDGIARVTFVGIPGTIDEVKLLAASPLLSGQLQYFINVQSPRRSTAATDRPR